MASVPLQLPPLGKQRMAQLIAEAKRVGLSPEVYAKQLVEDGLALRREAEEKSFAMLMSPVRRANVSESEVIQLVEKARSSHRRNGRRKKR